MSTFEAGLFLHVGYSDIERHAIERNSNLRLDSEVMLHKLTALLHNTDTSQNNEFGKVVSIVKVYMS